MAESKSKLEHLEWAIQSRASNQASALRLLKLFHEHEDFWKTKKPSRAAQDLTAVSFSLWRAAFLAEKSGRRVAVFAQGRTFLEKLIEDNAISYVQDKNSKEWTFNYYTRNARYFLQTLAEYWPNAASPYIGKKRNATERWEYCQSLLDEAVAGFEKLLVERKAKKQRRQQTSVTRKNSRARRAIVRGLALAGRSKATGPSDH
jgi:hypothetical protein